MNAQVPENVYAGPVPASPVFDPAGLVFDAAAAFDPFRTEHLVEVIQVEDRGGPLLLSVAVPAGIARPFVAMLESMAKLMKFVDHKAKIAKEQEKARRAEVDVSEIERRKRVREKFRKDVCTLFDGFIAEGCTVPEAVKRTNSTLKAKNHPYATYNLVEAELRSSGKFRRSGYKTRKEVVKS
jgi:hypothetical protein